MVSTGSIAANADRANQHTIVIKGQATAEDVDASDFFANHRIVMLAIIVRASTVGDTDVHRIAFLQPEQAFIGLYQ